MFLLLIEILGVEKSFRKPDEDLCPVLYEKRHQYYSQDFLPPPSSPPNSLPSLELLISVPQVPTECLHSILETPLPGGPCGRTQTLVAPQKYLELPTVAEPSTSHTKVLHQTKVLDLVTNNFLVNDI